MREALRDAPLIALMAGLTAAAVGLRRARKAPHRGRRPPLRAPRPRRSGGVPRPTLPGSLLPPVPVLPPVPALPRQAAHATGAGAVGRSHRARREQVVLPPVGPEVAAPLPVPPAVVRNETRAAAATTAAETTGVSTAAAVGAGTLATSGVRGNRAPRPKRPAVSPHRRRATTQSALSEPLPPPSRHRPQAGPHRWVRVRVRVHRRAPGSRKASPPSDQRTQPRPSSGQYRRRTSQ